MRLDPATTYLPTSVHYPNSENNASYAKEVEKGISNLLLNLRPIKKENLIRDDSKLVLLASLSDSLEFVADFVEGISLFQMFEALHQNLGIPFGSYFEMRIADAIIDLVGSGTTSRENNLKEIAGGVISQSLVTANMRGNSAEEVAEHVLSRNSLSGLQTYIDPVPDFEQIKISDEVKEMLTPFNEFYGISASKTPISVSLSSRFDEMFEVDTAHTTFESLKKWRDDSIDLFKRFIGLKAYKDALNALPKMFEAVHQNLGIPFGSYFEMGIADAIVDLVGSGTTSRENNLKEIAGGVISQSLGVLVASRKSLPLAAQEKLKKEVELMMKQVKELTNSVEIPTFEGRNDPEKFSKWLAKVEDVFTLKDVPEDKKVKLVVAKFQRHASTWWASVASKRKLQGKAKNPDGFHCREIACYTVDLKPLVEREEDKPKSSGLKEPLDDVKAQTHEEYEIMIMDRPLSSWANQNELRIKPLVKSCSIEWLNPGRELQVELRRFSLFHIDLPWTPNFVDSLRKEASACLLLPVSTPHQGIEPRANLSLGENKPNGELKKDIAATKDEVLNVRVDKKKFQCGAMSQDVEASPQKLSSLTVPRAKFVKFLQVTANMRGNSAEEVAERVLSRNSLSGLQVLGWAQALPKFAVGLVSYVQSFLERAYERCRTSYMEFLKSKVICLLEDMTSKI
ncbi:unnamed protein product [Cuscuta campestris]|uniref:ATP phosphoribosyltransferase n=1 Tax=Cuscuta campestris TaxID=132261 RepID=A0A484N0B9_9ASTE|nr:unnamed protein product [Cuscuta campestris]